VKVVPFHWRGNHLNVLDQRRLPGVARFVPCRSSSDVSRAIKDMAVRGAPAIGCVAAYGLVLAAQNREN
jgi:methylthioribose-1-phosphate isomerase